MSQQPIRISVIIPTRNRAKTLKLVIDSLLLDDYPNKEIVVFDGASTDGTQDLLRSYGGAVRWVSEPDEGEFDARNKAIALSTGELLRNLSDDDVPVPGGLQYAADYFQGHPETDLLFGQASIFYVQRDGTTMLLDGRKRTRKSVSLRNFIRLHDLPPTSETVFFRRDVIRKIGPFDNVRGGDYDYWARAAKAGLKIDICDQIFVHYYRYEEGEIKNAHLYRDLVHAHSMLANRHGTRWDRLYVRAYLIPTRLLVLGLRERLPRSATLGLRHLKWKVINRNAQGGIQRV